MLLDDGDMALLDIAALTDTERFLFDLLQEQRAEAERLAAEADEVVELRRDMAVRDEELADAQIKIELLEEKIRELESNNAERSEREK